mgnify:CR=1 FL=1
MNLLEEIKLFLSESVPIMIMDIPMIIWLIRLKKYYIPVIGTCVDVDWRKVVFEYIYESKMYKNSTPFSSIIMPKVNKRYKIYVLKWNPNKFILNKSKCYVLYNVFFLNCFLFLNLVSVFLM